MRLYTIYDKVAERPGPVITCETDGDAIREFADMFEKLENPRKVDEFRLMYLGELGVQYSSKRDDFMPCVRAATKPIEMNVRNVAAAMLKEDK